MEDLINSANAKSLQQVIDQFNLGIDLSQFPTLKVKREAVLLGWKIDQGIVKPSDAVGN